jgi:hypothetical protein
MNGMNMKRKILWGVSGFITFMVGVIVAWMFYYSSPKQPQLEHPPCRSCAVIYDSNSVNIPTLSFCDLASDPDRYHNQVVRVRAYIKHDAGIFFMKGLACQNPSAPAFFEYDSSMKACDGVQKVFEELLGYKHWCWRHPAGFDGEAGAVFVGRVERPKDPDFVSGGWRFRFVALCIEEAFSVNPDNPH